MTLADHFRVGYLLIYERKRELIEWRSQFDEAA
jgi:hypothetical protein